MLSIKVPVVKVVPPENVFALERFSIPAPALIIPNPPPLIIELTDKSFAAAPSAIVKVLVAVRVTGAPIVDGDALILVVTFPLRVMAPVPVMEESVMPMDPTLAVFVPNAKIPLLTVRALVTVMGDSSVTVPNGLSMVRLATVAGRPVPTDWLSVG